MKALVGAFNQEKALVGAFSVIVQPVVEPMDRFAALINMQINWWVPVCLIETSRDQIRIHFVLIPPPSWQQRATNTKQWGSKELARVSSHWFYFHSFFHNLNMVLNSISTNWWMRLACIKPRQWFLVIEIVGCSHLEALEMGIRAANELELQTFYNHLKGP